MLMDEFGYILSEAPVFILMIWFAVRYVQLRRARENRPAFSDNDRRMLFDASQPRTWRFYSRFPLAIAAVMIVGVVEIVALAPLGAAIISGVLLLSAAEIVRRILLRDH
jgi:hypothetical protein